MGDLLPDEAFRTLVAFNAILVPLLPDDLVRIIIRFNVLLTAGALAHRIRLSTGNYKLAMMSACPKVFSRHQSPTVYLRYTRPEEDRFVN